MIAEVIVDVLAAEVDRVFDYQAPEELGLREGDRVLVPFAGRRMEGFVLKLKERSDFEGKLKAVQQKLDPLPALTPETLELALFMAQKFHILIAESLRLFIPAEMRGGRVGRKERNAAALALPYEEAAAKLSKTARAQAEAVAYLKDRPEEDVAKLNLLFGHSAIRALLDKGILAERAKTVLRRPYESMAPAAKQITLNDQQQQAFDFIRRRPGEKFLLFGVTGSGKTEVYIRCIREALEQGKTAVMLVPEIGLTPQVLRRFRGEFSEQVAILHSGLSAGERYDEWWRLRSGEARVAVGARSAVFAPLTDIGVIIVDEQHEQSYQSESSPRYDALKVAARRAEQNGASLILGSATPLVETFWQAEQGKLHLLELSRRANQASLPPLEIVDMQQEVRRGNFGPFSQELEDALEETLASGCQAMIFLNRRGFSSSVICGDCGYVARCEHCDVSLVYHRAEELLKCHYCGARYRMLTQCPNCGGTHLTQKGLGTQRIVSELQKRFPKARILRMDNDTTSTKEAHLKITEQFFRGEADILVGTQMIAKGHDFEKVTLVGILDADQGLYMSDYRSGERTFSLICQVAGRAGRAGYPGRVLLQTHTPHHYLYRLVRDYDYKGFYRREIAVREAAQFPPFAVILRVMVQSDLEEAAVESLKGIYARLEALRQSMPEEFIYFNRMKSPVRRIKNNFRYQVLMRVRPDRAEEIEQAIYAALDQDSDRKVVKFLEINPSNLS